MKILTFADLHLRGTVPSCVDATALEWMNIQKSALDKVVEIAVENEVEEVYVGGDIFHSEQSTSFECVTMFQNFAKNLYSQGICVRVLFGNHDLKYHSSEFIDKSAVGVLLNSDSIFTMDNSVVKGCNFDEDDYKGHELIFKHVLCIPKEDKLDYIECDTPETLLEKYPHAKVIFTGDYHKHFCYKKYERYVINSGCLTKQASDFENYETGVYVTDLNSMSVKWCPVNISQKFVKNNNINKNNKNNFDDFVNGIKKKSVTLDFVGTLKNELVKQEKPVQETVGSWIEQIGE